MIPSADFEDVVFDEATRRCGNDASGWNGFVEGASQGSRTSVAFVTR